MSLPETHEEEHPSLAGAAQQNRMLAESLAEPLTAACNGRLADLRWFRTDWQRGGAATGHATWIPEPGSQDPAGRDRPGGQPNTCEVVVKLPVNTRELAWLRRMQDGTPHPPVPVLYAGGEGLNGYDMAWVVIERIPHGPLGTHWHDSHVERIAAAAARFYCQARRHPVDRSPRQEDWGALNHAARESVKLNGIAERQRWTEGLKSVAHRLDRITADWESRHPVEWVHGDLHLANAMSRGSMEEGEVCLIDLAEVRPGHWVEDAVYLERLLWAAPERLKATRPVRAVADARHAAGIEGGADDARLANIRRLLLAATAPAFIRSEGHPAYLRACLERMEQILPLVR
ncbi:MAG: aminoglycoside phosphotransferase family protein [Phycisphaerales bacterium]|nr:aminoglycoside phosphotransferase family protein [Phycisphaerales bacterium]